MEVAVGPNAVPHVGPNGLERFAAPERVTKPGANGLDRQLATATRLVQLRREYKLRDTLTG